MDYPFAALALTVTGPDPGSDRILEVAAVRHDGRRFHALTNPGAPVPYRLRLRLGLDEAALAAAPPFEAVARELAVFLDGLPLVSPDADRDVTFLRRHGLPLRAPAHDVRELASLFLPAAGDLGLRALARALGLPELPAETAEERARAVREIFPRLLAEAAALPPTVLAEVERLGSAIGWGLAPLFQAALEEALARTGAETEPMPSPLGMEFLAERGKGPPGLTPRAEPLPVTREEAAGVLEAAARADGPRLERRPEQLAMAGAVAEALSSGEHLLVEAGTGTGKSLAYLVPAAIYALRNSTRVAVSTNTINLQEQLTEKDIPALRCLLAEHGPPDVRGQVDGLRAVQLKGRRNYLCLQRWAGLRRVATFDPDEARFLLKLSVWLGRTQTGDRGELSLAPQEEAMWNRVNAQNVNCFAGPCPYVKSGRCFLLRAKRRAETAHLLVVNHALLLSDVATGGYVLPPYEHLVVDEAHNLEEEATQQFGFSAGAGDLTAYLDGLAPPPGPSAREGREGSLVTSVEHALRGLAGALPVAADLRAHCAALAQRVADARARLPEFFGPVEAFARENQEENGEYDNRVLLTHAKRSQPAWLDVELAWENLLLALEAVEQVLLKIQAALAGAEGAGLLEYEELLGDVVVALQQGQGLRRGISRIVHHADEETVAWLTVHRRTGHVSLASAPLFVGDILRDELFAKKDAVILTSATLTTGGRFDYVKQRLGLEEASELALGSPFDYRRAALILLPSDMPEPNGRGYAQAVERAIVDLCRASGGRALALFTSHAALRAARRAVREPLAREEITVLAQGVDGTPRELLNRLKSEPRTVVLGTASFWEGVDVVGEALSLLIIAKLPFSVPTEPIFAARSQHFEEPFLEYALPQAVLRFKQGFGRLIRQKTDRGALVVLDRRLRSKAYGRLFLESLPACTVREARLAALPDYVARWLGGEAPA